MDGTLAWAGSLFRRYYRHQPVELPPRFGRREYGFLILGGRGMIRHTGFQTREEIAQFLATRGPAHCYHSAAYYERPDATDMQAKGWLGADLIFDLDADHLPDAKDTPFPKLLQRCRDETVKVAEEFLIGHFGFSRDDLHIAFSGGRGYHIHVTHPSVQPLGAAERREIVDYVTGNGLDAQRFVRRQVVAVEARGEYEREDKSWRLPAADEPGWGGLITRTVRTYLEGLRSMEPQAAMATLVALPGIGEKRARSLVEQLRTRDLAPLQEGRVDHIPALAERPVLEAIRAQAHVRAIGEADEPVTSDVKRLIRLGGSLHGKTGLRVTTLTLSELARYDPLKEAVALGDEPVRIVLEKPAKVGLKGTLHALDPGEHEVPEHVAAFFVLQRKATIPVGVAA